MSPATINRTTGLRSFPSQNSPTTIVPVLRLESLPSLPIKATTPTSPSILNVILLPRELKTSLWTWTNFIRNSVEQSSPPNRHTKPQPTPNDFQHQTSRSETSRLSKHSSLEQRALPRNLPRSFWVLLKSLHILVLTQSL